MDAHRFDALSRALVTGHTRRSLARLLSGLSLGGVLSASPIREATAALLNGGFACTRDRECKTGNCLGSGKCSCSREFPTCKRPSNPCKKATCDFATKRCVIKNRADGVSCGSIQTCCGGTCTAGLLGPEGGTCASGNEGECCPGLVCTPGDTKCCRPEKTCGRHCCLNGTRCTGGPDYLCCASGTSCNRVCCPRASDICTIGDLECCPPDRVCHRSCCARDEFCQDEVECRPIVVGP